MNFVEKLNELRGVMGLQKQELAEVLGIKPGYVSELLSEKKTPSETLAALVDAMLKLETLRRSKGAALEASIREIVQDELKVKTGDDDAVKAALKAWLKSEMLDILNQRNATASPPSHTGGQAPTSPN